MYLCIVIKKQKVYSSIRKRRLYTIHLLYNDSLIIQFTKMECRRDVTTPFFFFTIPYLGCCCNILVLTVLTINNKIPLKI